MNSSAFLIGDNLLLTAAHNVHNGLFSRIRRAEVVCGRTHAGIVWHQPVAFGGQDTEVAEGYHFFLAPQHRDYALIRLPEPAAYPSSFRLLRPGDSKLKKGETIYTAGHPNEEPLCMDRMHVASGRIVSEIKPGDAFIDYDIKTLGGNSGGPVWVKRDNDYVVVGVHISGSRARGQARGRARRLDADALSELEAWGVPVLPENSINVLMPHGDGRSGEGSRGAHVRQSVQLQRHGMAAQ